jgi:hypothetical protein
MIWMPFDCAYSTAPCAIASETTSSAVSTAIVVGFGLMVRPMSSTAAAYWSAEARMPNTYR